MKEIKFYLKNAKKYLEESGYLVGKNGLLITGYIYDINQPKGGRFHARLSGKDENTITIHYDSLVNGFHTVYPSLKKLKAEKNRIIKKIHKVVRNEYCYYCLNCGLASGDGDGLVGGKCLLSKEPRG